MRANRENSAIYSTPSLSPPPFYSLIQHLLYRSATPSTPHFPFLKTLQLKTMVSLGPDLPTKVLLNWCEQNSVNFIHMGCQDVPTANQSWRAISEELVKDALEQVLQKKNLPCLLMDQSGIYETGMVVGCLRRLERWTLSSILAEYSSIAGSKSRANNEQFIELFDTDLVTLPNEVERVTWLPDYS